MVYTVFIDTGKHSISSTDLHFAAYGYIHNINDTILNTLFAGQRQHTLIFVLTQEGTCL